jgi:hypothetical protein
MKNIHILPTDRPSRLFKDDFDKYFISINIDQEQKHFKPQNIYITSDEEIKDGWSYDRMMKSIGKRDNVYSSKIILTTDQDLIKDGVQSIDDEFLEWFVKNPSCESVEIGKKCNYGECICYLGKCQDNENIYKIIIPQEELKTSEEWQNQFTSTKVLDPDGWDRKNYQYSWFEEKITLAEYESRLSRSTVKGHIPQEEPKQEKTFEDILDESLAKGKLILEELKAINSKQETLEEAAEKLFPVFQRSTPFGSKYPWTPHKEREAFKRGAKWQQERMYSEEDMKQFGLYLGDNLKKLKNKSIDEIFEQFKNI